MFYLSQPLTGLITKNSQLFSGRVSSLIGFSSSRRITPHRQALQRWAQTLNAKA